MARETLQEMTERAARVAEAVSLGNVDKTYGEVASMYYERRNGTVQWTTGTATAEGVAGGLAASGHPIMGGLLGLGLLLFGGEGAREARKTVTKPGEETRVLYKRELMDSYGFTPREARRFVSRYEQSHGIERAGVLRRRAVRPVRS